MQKDTERLKRLTADTLGKIVSNVEQVIVGNERR